MKFVGISQRVERVNGYVERRDCLDQRWSELAATLGWVALPLPNILPTKVQTLFESLDLQGVILSGGNSLISIDPNAPDAAPERDAFENAAIDAALTCNIPLVGVCRGMQIVNTHFGGSVTSCDGHVGTRHALDVDHPYIDLIDEPVNSYHAYTIGVDGLAPDLIPIACDDKGHIECLRHREHSIAGLMWHPERESPFRDKDIALLKEFLR